MRARTLVLIIGLLMGSPWIVPAIVHREAARQAQAMAETGEAATPSPLMVLALILGRLIPSSLPPAQEIAAAKPQPIPPSLMRRRPDPRMLAFVPPRVAPVPAPAPTYPLIYGSAATGIWESGVGGGLNGIHLPMFSMRPTADGTGFEISAPGYLDVRAGLQDGFSLSVMGQHIGGIDPKNMTADIPVGKPMAAMPAGPTNALGTP